MSLSTFHRLRGAYGTHGAVFAIGFLVLGFVLVACTAESSPDTTPEMARGPGAVLYLTYCQSCHGTHGVGDGPAASALRTPPADLTQLWRSYGTPLDRERIASYIDGRRLVSLHGWREMPIWGEEFFEDAPPTTPGLEDLKQRLIGILIEHLQTLQQQQQT